MEFKIKFSSDDDSVTAIDWNLIEEEGREILRMDPGAPVSSIGARWTGDVPISEDVARRSGHFMHDNEQYLKVPNGFLNQFVHHRKVGIQTGISVVSEIDADAIISAWEEAGYPTKWGFDELHNER